MEHSELQSPQKQPRRFKNLFALASGYFVDQGEAQAMSIFSPVLRQIWNLSVGNLSWITFVRSLLQALSSPFWGYMADKYSRKKVLFWGTGFWGLWTILVGLTQNFSQLILVRVISGIGLGCLMPATFSIMADTFPPKIRGRMLGYLEGVGVLGIIIFTVGLGSLATPEMWRYGFIILGVASILSGIIIMIFAQGAHDSHDSGGDFARAIGLDALGDHGSFPDSLAGGGTWSINSTSPGGVRSDVDRYRYQQCNGRIYWRLGRAEKSKIWTCFYWSNFSDFRDPTDDHFVNCNGKLESSSLNGILFWNRPVDQLAW